MADDPQDEPAAEGARRGMLYIFGGVAVIVGLLAWMFLGDDAGELSDVAKEVLAQE